MLVCCIHDSHPHAVCVYIGFENFFPKGGGSPKKPPMKNNKKGTDKKASSSSSKKESETTKESSSNQQTKKKKKKKKKKAAQQEDPLFPPRPPYQQQQEPNVGALAALLLVVLGLRSVMDSETPSGKEITWKDFRTYMMAETEKIVVVNKKVARVYLTEDAKGMPGGAGGGGGGVNSNHNTSGAGGVATNAESTSWNDGTQMDWGHDIVTSRSSSTLSSSSADSSYGVDAKSVYHFYIGSVESLEEKLTQAQQELGIAPRDYIPVQYVSETNWTVELVKSSPALLMVGGLMLWMLRGGATQMAGRNGGIFQIGKSNAKKITKEEVSVTFDDVAGCQEAKKEIMEFVDFLQDSSVFTKLGAKIPKGALLCGPPGTGKTLLAKAVAGEAGVPFYSISGSDFIEMFVGVGPSRVRDLFKEARSNSPCIVFIDEIDAVGRQRGRGGVGGNDERENTLNQLLVEMDGFNPSTGVVVLAGTNRVDILDQALTRPGRFDRQITVDKPDLQGRKEIFQVHLKGLTLEDDMDDISGRLAGLTPGFAGADIANICNEAAIVAARRKGDSVAMEDFEKATDRIIGGLESNKIMSKEERSIVAYHEAGHAVAGWFLEHADPLLKVTIIPRSSGALGYAQYLPKEVFLRSHDQIMDIVCMALAGRAAEEVFFGRVTTGAADDLRRVTQLVYSTIHTYGMNSRVGQLAFPQQNENALPGDKPYSDATAEAMDEEARAVVDKAYQRTLDLIRQHKTQVEKVATTLLDKETITHDDIVDLVGPRPFEGDDQYQEFVSKRKAMEMKKKKKEEDEEATHAKDDETKDSDGGPLDESGLTPGLV